MTAFDFDTGAISELFDVLYDDDVVSDTTFFRWRDERMFGEQCGRGVAISTLNQFFKWLEEDTTTTS
jgi:translation initiation factor 4G